MNGSESMIYLLLALYGTGSAAGGASLPTCMAERTEWSDWDEACDDGLER
jgi:hypothetical protein